MAQVPCTYRQVGDSIDHTPGSNVAAGDVVLLNSNLVTIAKRDIPADTLGAVSTTGLFNVPKVTGAIEQGEALYWDADGNPVDGTVGSGAFTTDDGDGVFAGFAASDAESGDGKVDLYLRSIPDTVGIVAIESFGEMPRIPSATVAATGSAQGDAAAITTGFTLVSAADATKGVILPAAVAGEVCIVKNGAAAVLKLYPATGDAINALSANAALSMAANTSAVLVAYDATTWYTTPLLPS